MSLTTKILLVVACPVFALGALLSIAYDRSARAQVQQQYVDKARSVVLSAESMREEMATKWRQGIFTPAMLRTWADEGKREHILSVLAKSPSLDDAARTLGIDASTLWRKRKRYGV